MPRSKLASTLLAAAVTLTITVTESVTAATSVSQFGITWTWNEDRTVGQFANGDWWVVGPISLTGPRSTNNQSGSMLNPDPSYWPTQGFDDRVENLGYSASINIGAQLPRSIAANSSIVSSVSYGALRGRNQLDSLAVLTVLPSAPPAGSFRPPFLGSVKTVTRNKSEIIYDRLQHKPLITGASRAYAESLMERTMFNIGSAYPSNYTLGWYNTPILGKNYGREITLGIARVGLELNLNYTNAEKELMAIRMIQHGLDIYRGVVLGQEFEANGGHQGGRKLALLMAGWLLNDNNILARCNRAAYPTNFAEDVQHFFVTQNDINTPRAIDNTGYRPMDPYPQSSLGMPEWGPEGGYPKNTAGYNWGRIYRNVACPNFVGEALAVKIMGLESTWNHPAFFTYYTDRFVPIEHNLGSIDGFALAMWDAYSGSAVVPPPPAESSLAIGDRVETTSSSTNVRAGGSLSATLVGTQTLGAVGTIVAGPVQSDSIIWWQIDYDSGADGWSGASSLVKSTTTPPTPPPASAFAIGDRIATIKATTNVRASGALSGTLLGTQLLGALGTIIAGPVVMDSFTWWQLDYDTGADGWCGEDHLTKSTTPAPTPTKPSPPTGLRVE